MEVKFILLLMAIVVCVKSKPLEILENDTAVENNEHKLTKRFINPQMTSGQFSSPDISKIRAKRDLEEECEKLRLCKLHASSNRNFLAAFELYFINKENARLWDHHARSFSECEQRYSCYR